MKGTSLGNSLLALILCATLTFTTGCPTSWINTAIKDLPVLVQIATSILGIVAAAQGQGQLDPAMAATVTQAGNEAKADLTLLQNLVDSYQVTPSADTLAKIDAGLSSAQGHMQDILAAFHVKNPGLQAAISGAVGLALTTIVAIQTLVPAPAGKTKASAPLQPLSPGELKKEANAYFAAYPEAQLK